MSYVKNYDIGNIRADLPENQFTYELPLLSFGDIKQTINLSLVFNSKYAEENRFDMSNGFKLNLHKQLILQSGIPGKYVDSDGSRVNLIKQSNNSYTFDDDSQRIIRGNGNNFILENPDLSTETFTTLGKIISSKDKYGETYLTYIYSNNKVASITYRDKVINITYNNLGAMGAVEYVCNGSSICTTTLAYNGVSSAIINHYSGVKYYVQYYAGNFMAYSSNDSTYETYSQKINCNKQTDSLSIEKLIGEKTVDRTSYNFLYAGYNTNLNVTLPTFFPAVDITDFHGIVTRVQYENKKPLYSYELTTQNSTNIYEKSFYKDADERFYYGGTVNVNKHNLAVKQTMNDGIKLTQETTGNKIYWEIESFDSSQSLYGNFLITGWVYPSGNNTTCTIYVRDHDDSYDSPTHNETIENLIPSMWNYVAVECKLRNPRSLSVNFEINSETIFSTDLRLTFLEGKIYETDNLTHITSTRDVMVVDGNASNDTVFSFDEIKFYNGNNEISEKITAKDILKYKINQKYGTNKNEIYYNECKGIIPNAGTLYMGYTPTGSTTITKLNVETLSVGKYSKKDDRESYTKINYYLSSSNNGYFASTSFVNTQEIKKEIYDDNLDIISTTIDGITTSYERIDGLLTRKTIGGITIMSAEYDTGKTMLLNTTNEFGLVTNYETNTVWGNITKSNVANELSITDTFDDDGNTVLTKTFSDATNTKQYSFSYNQSGLLGMLTTGDLTYNFNYSYGELSAVAKNSSPVEQLSLSDDRKTLTASYPTESSPIYSLEYKTDNYGRTTQITGLITNTYKLHSSDGFINLNNGSSKLAESTDLITENVTKYEYDSDKLKNVTVYDSDDEEVSIQTFSYDNANRITSNVYTYEPGIFGKKTKTIFTYVKDDTDAYIDNRVKTCKYNINSVTRSKTQNQYDSLKRLSKKSVDLNEGLLNIENTPFEKSFIYNGTRLETIREYHSVTCLGVENYSYDWYGRISANNYSSQNNTYNKTYVYDSFGQLIRENNQALDKTFIYSYNNIGNITNVKAYAYTNAETPSGSYTQKTFSYSDNTNRDRLTKYGYNNISYNSLGYPISYGNKNYVWTKGKLTRLHDTLDENSSNSADNVVFRYDAYGNRISKVFEYFPGADYSDDYLKKSTTRYNYDHNGRLIREYCTEEYYASDSKTREFIYLYDESGIIGTMYSYNGATAQPYYYRRNAQGDVTAIYDENGIRKVEYAYDAFGNCTVLYSGITDLANNNPIRYRGYYYDKQTNLYYLNARYYSPEWCRFISPDDTAYLDPETPNGLNLYTYCNNDPVNYADPSGHFVLSSFLVGLGIAAAIGAGVGVASYVVSQGINYAVTGDWEWSWGGFAGSIVGGAVGGIIAYAFPYFNIGSAAWGAFFSGGFTTTGTMIGQNITDNAGYSALDILISSGITGSFSAISVGVMGKIRIPGLNAGRGSYSAISNQIYTKFRNQTISRVTVRTFGKMLALEAYNGIASFILEDVYGYSDVDDWILNLF